MAAQKIKKVDPDSKQAAKVRREFKRSVNMTRRELQKWLKTDDAKAVGHKRGDSSRSVGYKSGRRIVKILDKRKADLTSGDLAHMKKVNGYVARHLKQRPDKRAEDLAQTTWAKSLKNWGHDPQKKKKGKRS